MTDPKAEKDAARDVPGYADEMAQVRQEVVSLNAALTQPVEQPTAVFTGGQPGAGKSRSIVEPLEREFDAKGGIAVVDPDAIRPLFSQAQQEMTAGRGFSNEAYEAAGTVAYQISMDLAQQKRNVLRDGTLANLKYPQQEMAEFRAKDYRVEAHIAAVYTDLSFARTVVRTEREVATSDTGFGRTVDRAFHDSAVAGVAKSTATMWNDGLVDRLVLYDSHGTRVFDYTRADGKWLDAEGRPHQGLGPKERLEHHQHSPNGRDLVDAAKTWQEARALLLSPERPVPASEATIAGVEREVAHAYQRVVEMPKALGLADASLRKEIEAYRERPLAAAAEAWKRNPAEAEKQWPEHAAKFRVAAEATVQCEAELRARGQGDAGLKAREFMADQLARGAIATPAREQGPVREVRQALRREPDRIVTIERKGPER